MMNFEATKSFLCGQVVSIFSLMALVMAKRLVHRSVNTPMLLNLAFYFVLAVVYLLAGLCKPSRSDAPPGRGQVRWWFYPFLALIDIQANICAVKSLEYLSFATTGLLLNLAVPFVFTQCVCMFGASYKWKHLVGCLLTVVGACVVLLGCMQRQQTHAFGSQQEVYGFILAVLAAALYASSNVVNQWCLKIRGVDGMVDCLAKIGAWGTLFCAVQVALAERGEILAVAWDAQIAMLFVGYVLSMFAFYTAVYVLVRENETTIYNLSLLFSSVYLMLIAHNTLDETLDVYTWAAMLLMLCGLGIYSWTRAATDECGTSGLPQIGFKSMQTPREEMDLVLNKMQLAQV